MTKDELKTSIERAVGYHSDTSREYEVNLTNLVNTSFDVEIAEDLLKEFMDSGKVNLSYAVFYCINIYHRNLYNNDLLSKAWDLHAASFNEYNSLTHLDVNRFRISLSSDITPNDQHDYLEKAYDFSRMHPDNAGFLHSFCALFASILELNENNADLYAEFLKKWKDRALLTVDAAISKDSSYAKYYCTKGRILSADGEYDNADKEICMAIAKENSKREDYAVRISDYQYYRLQNQLRRQRSIIAEEQESISSIKNSIVSNIETIALFSGIISFVLGSLKLADGETSVQAGLLIIVLMGCLSAVFAIFTLLLHAGDNTYKKITAILVMIASIIVSVGAIILLGGLECLK